MFQGLLIFSLKYSEPYLFLFKSPNFYLQVLATLDPIGFIPYGMSKNPSHETSAPNFLCVLRTLFVRRTTRAMPFFSIGTSRFFKNLHKYLFGKFRGNLKGILLKSAFREESCLQAFPSIEVYKFL